MGVRSAEAYVQTGAAHRSNAAYTVRVPVSEAATRGAIAFAIRALSTSPDVGINHDVLALVNSLTRKQEWYREFVRAQGGQPRDISLAPLTAPTMPSRWPGRYGKRCS